VRNGDRIHIDAARGRMNLQISDSELLRRRKSWKAPKRAAVTGVLEKYAAQVGSAHLGAVTHSGPRKGV
jgi:dihydroxy-acid dehydratase